MKKKIIIIITIVVIYLLEITYCNYESLNRPKTVIVRKMY